MLERTERIAHTGSWEWDPRTGVSTWSAETYRFFGLDPAQSAPTANRQMELLCAGRCQAPDRAIRQGLADGQPYDIEVCIVRPDGERRYGHILGIPERDDSGKVVLLAGSLQDITERKLAQERLQLAASVFTHAREGITITDADGTIVDVNATFTQITGYSPRRGAGPEPRACCSPADRARPSTWPCGKRSRPRGTGAEKSGTGARTARSMPRFVTISAVRDITGNTQHYVSLGSDITASKTHQSELERIAHYDTLTGLPNRLLLGDRLRQAIAQGQRRNKPLAVVYLDLDNIKAVNDTHGHEAGDAVLIAVCQAMQESPARRRHAGPHRWRRVCGGAGRSGSDRRLHPGHRATAGVCDHCGDTAGKHGVDDAVPDQRVQVSASIGVTFYPQDDVDADVLLRHADQAMYQAKQAGKNRYHLFDIANDVGDSGPPRRIESHQRGAAARRIRPVSTSPRSICAPARSSAPKP